jgi:metal-sulfur cluster biosynthetic enzyme
MSAGLDSRIRAALDQVMDPCSVAAGRPLSLLAMGLVPGWEMRGSTLHIRFGVTFAGCTMAPHFLEAARTLLLQIDGIDAVDAVVDTSFVWVPEQVPPPALEGRPQAWRERVSAR